MNIESCRALVLDAADPDDRAVLERLRADPSIEFVDHLAEQREELSRLRPSPGAEVLAEPCRWAYYPWRRTVAAVLGPRAFRAVRLDRNRNVITAEEQTRLGALRIGVAGLSVGHVIAHTLAAQGMCGEVRLADFDRLELSNLNRVPASVLDLGLNKAEVAARRIAELDPYLSVRVADTGLTVDTVDEFLDGLDIVVEECDSLDMKAIVRQRARARRIPVLMATSDRGLLDVERFDLEPQRPILHGLLGDLDFARLAGMSSREKVPHLLRFLEADELSSRMLASVVEIDRTLSTWPQVSGDVVLGATAVAEAVRRIGLGEELPSGRTRIDVGSAFNELDEPQESRHPSQPDENLEPALPGVAGRIAAAAIRAPSGGNAQPWNIDVRTDAITIRIAPEHRSTMDVGFRGSAVALGAALFNAKVAAASQRVLGPVKLLEGVDGVPLQAMLHLGDGDDPQLGSLYQPMLARETNRRLGTARPISANTIERLRATAEREGARLHLLTGRDDIARAATILAATDRIRYLTPGLHADMFAELRWPGDPRPDTGIDVRSLELEPGDVALLDILRRPDVMAHLAQWNAGTALGEDTRRRVVASSAIAIISVPEGTLTDYARGGSAVEAVWITAQQHALAVQPISPVFLYAQDAVDVTELSMSFADELSDLREEFRQLCRIPRGNFPVLVLRFAVGRPASVRSRRSRDRVNILQSNNAVTKSAASVKAIAGALDDLVTAAAADLMAATAANHAAISQRVLRDLVDHLGVDSGFLRHNDHTIHATVLVAEWPPRENVPDPDPIGVVYFANAEPIFASAENLRVPVILRPEPTNVEYQARIEMGSGIPAVSGAGVPLLSGDVTTGTLGFIKYGDREWTPEELNALQAIATLFAQLQARIVAEEQIHYLAEHDDLTGLLNRRALIAHLDDRLAAGQPGPIAVLLLDVDRLKVINDHLGHNAGDRFITAFAELLRDAANLPSVVARFGGDEFVVVPTAPMDVEDAEAFAQWLQNRVRQQVEIDGEMLSRTVSIGVAVGTPGADDTSMLLRRADQAALSAKGSGGRKVARFSPEMSEKYAIRNDIELQLEGTIDRGSGALVLHYLPEFDMRTGEVLGAEALIRWHHPTRGLLMPDSFIGVVESINLAGRLGRLVMRSAFEQFKLWRSRGVGQDAVLRVNVSPIQLVAQGTVDLVAASLDAFGLQASAVCLEITESVVVQDIDATHKTLAGLKDIGVQIAIDDFGTGYSALAYLKSLPVDALKIDKGFVRELGTHTGDQAIVRSIMSLSDAFGLDVIAEGVETPAAARALLDLNCYRAQGFLLSRPLDGTAMESLLAKRFVPMEFSDLEHSLSEGSSASEQ